MAIENGVAPVGMKALLRIGMLVEVRAVEITNAVFIRGENVKEPSRG